MSAALLAYLAARKRNKQARKQKTIDAVVEALMDDEDIEEERLAKKERDRVAEDARQERVRSRRETRAKESFGRRWRRRIFTFLDQTSVQTVQYIAMLFLFQSLSTTIRIDSEFYMDRHLSAMILTKKSPAGHRQFDKVHHIAHIWEWARSSLTPAVFHNAEYVEAWPDGVGAHSSANATPYSLTDLVNVANVLRVESVVFKQVRMRRNPAKACYKGHACTSVLRGERDEGNMTAFGHGAEEGRFRYWSTSELGADPDGVQSSSAVTAGLFTTKRYSSGGFVALWRPFFSDALLPAEEGYASDVTDFRQHEALASNGRLARYQCARYSIDGHWIVQRCDPSPEASAGALRAMFAELLDRLKKGRWVDLDTGVVSVSLLVRNENEGVRFYCKYIFERTSSGAMLPSFDVETRLEGEEVHASRMLWLYCCAAIILWFVGLELIELINTGPLSYVCNGWNVLDWLNFILFFLVFAFVLEEAQLHERDASGGGCVSLICNGFGYRDPWELFKAARQSKFFLSLCVAIQFLKIIKFTNVLVPKMSLMSRVLSKGASDLAFFAIILMISIFAFANLFSLQLGHAMDDFTSLSLSTIAMVRGLFGDFHFNEVVENSPGTYLNAVLFLVYLFVAVFILLALFLSILGESQAAAREDEAKQRASGEDPSSYGVIGDAAAVMHAILEDCVGYVCGPQREKQKDAISDSVVKEKPQMPEHQRIVLESLHQFRPHVLSAIDVHLNAFEKVWAKSVDELQQRIITTSKARSGVRPAPRERLKRRVVSGKSRRDLGRTGVGAEGHKENRQLDGSQGVRPR